MPTVLLLLHQMLEYDKRTFKCDVAKAKAKLAEGGEPNGFQVSMKVINAPLQIQIAQLLPAQAREAGIEIKSELLDFTALLAQLRAKDFTAISDGMLHLERVSLRP